MAKKPAFKALEGETVALRAKLTKLTLLIPVIIGSLIAAVFLIIYLQTKEFITEPFDIQLVILMAASYSGGAVWIIYLFFERIRRTEVVITNKRILIKGAFFLGADYKELPLEYVECEVKKSYFLLRKVSFTDKSGNTVFSGFLSVPEYVKARFAEQKKGNDITALHNQAEDN